MKTLFGYEKGKPLQYLAKRVCGLWLVWISLVILAGALLGGKQMIQMPVFMIGYFVGVILILANKRLQKKLSFGPPSPFQKKMSVLSIVFMLILLFTLGGPHFADQNYRLIWLNAFLAIGIHFVPFAIVHGKMMLPLAVLTSVNALVGIFNPHIDFIYLAYIDVAIKLIFGLLFLFTKKPDYQVNEVKMDAISGTFK